MYVHNMFTNVVSRCIYMLYTEFNKPNNVDILIYKIILFILI